MGHQIRDIHGYSLPADIPAQLLEAKEKDCSPGDPPEPQRLWPFRTAAAQGAGLIGAYNMVHYQTVISPCQILLNDTTNFKSKHTIKITNGRSRPISSTTTCGNCPISSDWIDEDECVPGSVDGLYGYCQRAPDHRCQCASDEFVRRRLLRPISMRQLSRCTADISSLVVKVEKCCLSYIWELHPNPVVLPSSRVLDVVVKVNITEKTYMYVGDSSFPVILFHFVTGTRDV